MSKYPSSKMLKDVKMYYLEKYMESPDEVKAQEIIQDLMKDYRTDEMAMYDVGTYYLVSGSKMLKDSASLTDGIRMEAMKNIDKCFDYYTGIFIAGPWKAKSEIYYQMKNKEKALECINKALAIWDKESYRKQKDKIEKL